METGHAVNIDNFNTLITKCTGFGAPYNPGNARLKVANMQLQYTAGFNAHKALNTALENSKQPINDREILFDPLDDIITRSLASLDSLDNTDASARVKKDARTIGDDIRGFNAKRPKLPPNTTPTEDFLSQSHQSFVQRTDNFDRYIKLLKTIPAYAPNEADIKILAMETLRDSFITSNEGMAAIINTVETARILRNKLLYEEDKGIIDTAKKCKAYVKSVFKVRSQEFRLVSGIAFRGGRGLANKP